MGRSLAKSGLPSTGGSDAHAEGDIGACATEFLGPVSGLEDMIAALKAGRCRPVIMNGRARLSGDGELAGGVTT